MGLLQERLKQGIKKALDENFVQTLVIAALIIITSMFVVHFATYKPERYSAIGLLNENKQTGPFPDTIEYNGTLNLYVNVLNRLGQPELFRVRAIVGNNDTEINESTGAVIDGSVIETSENLVNQGEDWELLSSITFNASLVGQKKVIFDLWQYNAAIGQYNYLNQSVHIWIEVLPT